MKSKFVPFYISRAALSAAFAFLIMGLTWKAMLLAIALFGSFLLYLHSGWFRIDLNHPLTPIRRDDRGRQIQRKALIAAVTVGLLSFVILPQASEYIGLSLAQGPLVLSLGMMTYFITQFVLFART